MPEELHDAIARIKPLADAVEDAANSLNFAINAAAEGGLSVRLDVREQPLERDGETRPVVRARISKRIA